MSTEFDEDDLFDMSDEDLEAAFREAKQNVKEYPEGEPEAYLEEDQEEDADAGGTLEADEVDVDPSEEDTDDENGTSVEQPDVVQDSNKDVGGDKETDKPEEEKPSEEASKGTEVSAAPETLKFKANGKEYEFTEDEIKTQFPKVFGQAMDYTKKMQAIAPWRKTIDAIEQAKLNHSDVNLMIDALKGDKGALSEVLKRTSTDALDLTSEETNYTPNDYGRDSTTLAVHDALEDIRHDPEYAITHRILTSGWDESSWHTLSKDPTMIKGLHEDVKSGVYQEVQARADKMKLYDGGKRTDLDYYLLAGQEYYRDKADKEARLRAQKEQEARILAEQEAVRQERLAKAKQEEQARAAASAASRARKAAAPSASAVSTAGSINYLDASDEEFEEWYKKIGL